MAGLRRGRSDREPIDQKRKPEWPWRPTAAAALISLVGLWYGLWWLALLGGVAAGWATRDGERDFLPAFTGTLAAWLGLYVWRAVAWRGLAQLGTVTALAGLPAVAGILFVLAPSLLAAVGAGLAALATVVARRPRETGDRLREVESAGGLHPAVRRPDGWRQRGHVDD